MKLHLVGVLGLALSAAACTSVTKIETAGAGEIYHVQCNGGLNDISLCKVAAGTVCPKGYVEVGRGSDLGPVYVTPTFYIDYEAQRSLDVRCK